MSLDGALTIRRVRCHALALGSEGVDGILMGAGCSLEERLHAKRQLVFGVCRRVHVNGVELGDALCFVSGGNVDGVNYRRASATSLRERSHVRSSATARAWLSSTCMRFRWEVA